MTGTSRTPSDDPRSPPNGPQPPFTSPNPHLPPTTAFGTPPTPPGGMPTVSGPPGYGPPPPPGYGQPVPLGPPILPRKRGLSTGVIVAIVTGGLLALCLILGTLVALASPASNKGTPAGQQSAATTAAATPSASPGSMSPTVEEQPAIERRTVTETATIPFEEKTINDPSLAAGTSEMRTRGVAGVKTLT
jgi:hypothetical protein